MLVRALSVTMFSLQCAILSHESLALWCGEVATAGPAIGQWQGAETSTLSSKQAQERDADTTEPVVESRAGEKPGVGFDAHAPAAIG